MKKHLFYLHTAVLLFGLSGLFGKLVDVPAEIIVSGRVISASLFLYILLHLKKEEVDFFSGDSFRVIFLQGGLLFIHWYTFFQAIKLSTVALGLLSFSSFPIFTTFLEPFFFSTPLRRSRIAAALVTFMGILIVSPLGGIERDMFLGVVMGIISGFTFSLLALSNKKFTKTLSGLKLTFYQCLGASIFSLPVLISNDTLHLSIEDIALLTLLGVVFTGIAHTLFVSSLKELSATTVSITTCLEPVYGIAFAAFILGEIPDLRILIGSSLIILAAFSSARE